MKKRALLLLGFLNLAACSVIDSTRQWIIVDAEVALDADMDVYWRRGSVGNFYAAEEARSVCDDLATSLSQNWRVPSHDEFASALEMATLNSRPDRSDNEAPTIPVDVFPSQSGLFWSDISAELGSTPDWIVDLDDGTYRTNIIDPVTAHARCVAGGETVL